MHWKECEIEADHHQPEDPAPDVLVQQSTRDLWKPVIGGSQDRKERPTTQHVVEVTDDVVRIVGLPIHRHRREVNSGQPADSELQHKRQCVQHRHAQVNASTP